MNNSPESEKNWDDLLTSARRDVGPSVDIPALMRALAQPSTLTAASPTQLSWTDEFHALFGNRRVILSGVLGICALTAFASWQVWETVQALPWSEWIDSGSGGVL